jgi:ABC-type Fe3+ transport system substrate-binding protein
MLEDLLIITWRVCLIVLCTGTLAGAQAVKVVSSLDPELLEFIAGELAQDEMVVEFTCPASDADIPDMMRDPASKPEILYGVSTIVLSRLADRGLLEAREPVWARELPVGLMDREGRWISVFGDPLTIVYNRAYFWNLDESLESLLPEGWEDLTARRMRGSLILEKPAYFNETGYLFACLIDRAEQVFDDREIGFDLLKGIDENLLRTYDSTGALLSETGLFSGMDGSISAATLSACEQCYKAELPVNLVVPVEGMFLYPQGAALVNGTRTAAAAVYDALLKVKLLSACARESACFPLILQEEYRYTGWLGRQQEMDIFPTDHDAVRRNIDAWLGQWQNLIQGSTKRREQKLDDAINTVMIFLIPLVLAILIYTSRKRR